MEEGCRCLFGGCVCLVGVPSGCVCMVNVLVEVCTYVFVHIRLKSMFVSMYSQWVCRVGGAVHLVQDALQCW